MTYNDFKGKKLSALGFGTMRLPTKADGEIDSKMLDEMVDYAMSAGVNYFDTAWPYHLGKSELEIARSLARYPRESYYLADKYPGHQIFDTYYPDEIFELQLKKCNVEYFDFYLLHNVYEKSLGVYEDERWDIINYFIEQKRLGRIKHLGFSTHGRPDNMREFLSKYGEYMEFCQIQLNYLDWTLQQAKEKYELLCEYNIPVWVMEPLRGGKLAHLDDESMTALSALRSDESAAGWSFRFLQSLPNVTMVLSGMSDTEQMKQNVKTFERHAPTNDDENAVLFRIAETLKNAVPCTACRYCCEGCPMGLDIPDLISIYNDASFGGINGSLTASMQIEAMDEAKRPHACIGCGACENICPQKINVPDIMEKCAALTDKLPKWSVICEERKAAEKALIDSL